MKAGTMIASTFLTVGILIVGFFAPEAVTAVVEIGRASCRERV